MIPVAIQLDRIVVDDDVQPRASLHEDTIEEYADIIRRGDVMPPLDVFEVGGKYILSSGFHRMEAHRRVGSKSAQCTVLDGDLKDAREHAIVSNLKHGRRYTNADKRRIVRIMLEDRPERSDREIARLCGVSNNLVSGMRPQHLSSDDRYAESRTVERNGTTYEMKVPRPKPEHPVTCTSEKPSLAIRAVPEGPTSNPYDGRYEPEPEDTEPVNDSGYEVFEWLKKVHEESHAFYLKHKDTIDDAVRYDAELADKVVGASLAAMESVGSFIEHCSAKAHLRVVKEGGAA